MEEESDTKILSCGHHGYDLSRGYGPERNYICYKCNLHFYKDREWTKDEWEKYVNDFSHDPESPFNKKK